MHDQQKPKTEILPDDGTGEVEVSRLSHDASSLFYNCRQPSSVFSIFCFIAKTRVRVAFFSPSIH